MTAYLDKRSINLEFRAFVLDIAFTRRQAKGEPLVWAEKSAQGCRYGRIGPVEFSFICCACVRKVSVHG